LTGPTASEFQVAYVGASFDVTTTSAITGNHAGAVLVASGTTVLVSGATVSGAMVVSPGGSVDVENSTISGSLSASEPGAVRICASAVHGSVTVNGASGFVVIGDPANGCPANVIGGSVTLDNNNNGVDAIDNTVTGNVVTSGNSGNGPFPGDIGPQISGSHH
jgi:hypothetical protein